MKSKVSKLALIKNTTLDGNNSIAKFSKVEDSRIGFGSYIASYSKVFKCNIGRYCSISQKVQIVFGNHPTEKFVSTYPGFYARKTQSGISYVKENKFEEYTYADRGKKWYVEIGNDVWIGYDVKILSGIHIGDGAVVAAGSVVTKDVEPYSIVGGIPAKEIRKRFSEKDIEFLENLKWWDKDKSWIEKYAEDFEDISRLKARICHG